MIRSRDPEVTRRGLEILQAIADGRHPKQVAGDLAISRSTIQSHLKKARQVLRTSSTGAAIAALMRRGDIT